MVLIANQHDCIFEYHKKSETTHQYCCSVNSTTSELFDFDILQYSSYASDFEPVKNDSLFFLHQNLRSMNKNINELQSFINQLKCSQSSTPTVIGVTETWLTSQDDANLARFQIPGYHFLHSSRKIGKGGGTGLYIKNDIDFTEVTDYNVFSQCESTWIAISINKTKIIVGVLYSSGTNRNKQLFSDELDELLEHFNNQKKKVIILGDMNIDLLSIKTTDSYYKTLITNGFKNTFSFATRVVQDSETLIDHIITNLTDTVWKSISGTIMNDISDHNSTFVIFPHYHEEKKIKESNFEQVFSFKNYHAETAKNHAADEDWADVLNSASANDAYDIFQAKLATLQSRVIQKVKITEKNFLQKPWMTHGIRRAQKQRYKLYKKTKLNPNNQIFFDKYKRYRNLLCRIMRNAEKDYYTRLIEEANGDQGRTWHVIKDIMGRKKKKLSLPDKIILNDGSEVEGKNNVQKALNNHFTNIGKELASQISPSNKKPEDFVPELSNASSFFFNPITEYDIFTALSRLKKRKSFGPDCLHPRFIKDIAEEIVTPLTYIANLSIESGTFPTQLKIARIVPLYKGGDKKRATNYRPISLLSVFAKILEGLVYDRLVSYFEEKHLFTDAQFGFRKNKSTKAALIRFINRIQHAVDDHLKTAAIYIDLKKAFDTVDHEILLNKLLKYGIRGVVIDWIKSYLNDRKQFIETENEVSLLKCGVPQGSKLGPLLFLIYVNDLPSVLKETSPTLFADDTTIHGTASNYDELARKINSDLSKLSEWFKANKLTLNVQKSFSCIFGMHQKQKEPDFFIDGQKIENSDTVKYLGVYVDSHLTWLSHIHFISNKISQTIGVLSKIKHCLNEKTLKTLYYSLIHSRLIYCQEIWGSASKSALEPLVRIQKNV